MKKRIILITIIGLFLLILPLMAGAEIVDSGLCGDNVNWVLDDKGTLTISGFGSMNDFERTSGRSTSAPYNAYSTSITNVIIEDGVTIIGGYAFYGCNNLTSVTIPQGVTKIGFDAFGYCESLIKVSLPQSITLIDNWAFESCSSLESINIPENVTLIGIEAFQRCKKITSLSFPQSVTKIWNGVFYDCEKLSCITILGCNTELDLGLTGKLSSDLVMRVVQNSPAHTVATRYKIPVVFLCSNHNLFEHPKNNPTCSETGLEAYYYCDVCGIQFPNADATSELLIPIEIPALGHNLEHYEEKAPTCTTEGNDEYWLCTRCSKYFSDADAEHEISLADTVIAATGHDDPMAHTAAVAATCITAGNTEYWHCAKCGKYFSDADAEHEIALADTVIATTDHIVVIDSAVAPTHTESGLTEGSHCSVCNSVITPQEVLPPIAVVSSGSCGSNVYWKLYGDGFLSIYGSGYMTSHPWTQNKEQVKSIEIQEGVLNIVDYAFQSCTNLESISLPESGLSIIGDQAFMECTSLKSISLPESVVAIGASAFCTCTSLESIIIPDGVRNIGDWCFMASEPIVIYANVGSNGAKALGKINTPFRTNEIACLYLYKEKDGSYSDLSLYSTNDTTITTYEIPNFVTSIHSYAFKDCTSLTEVAIPDSVEQIGEYAFLNCSNLTDITIPERVTLIENSCFFQSGIQTITFNGQITDIKSNAFYNCPLTSIDIPDSVERIGEDAFSNCPYLSNVSLPASVVSIGSTAFKNCYGLKTISISASLGSIGSEAFKNCFYLSSIKVPACNSYAIQWFKDNNYQSALDIGPHASIVIDPAVPPTQMQSGLTEGQHCSVCGKILVAQEVAPADPESPIIDRGNCGNEMTWTLYNTGLLTISGSGEMTSHPWTADTYKNSFHQVIIEDGVTSIGDYAFYGVHSNSELTEMFEVSLPSTLERIGRSAFYGVHNWKNEKIIIPNKVTVIGEFCFSNTDITGIQVSTGITEIPTCAFADCDALVNVTIPESVTTIGKQAFWKCISIEQLKIPNGVTSMGLYSLAGLTGLKELTIPVEFITSNQIFYNSDSDAYTPNLEKLHITSGTTGLMPDIPSNGYMTLCTQSKDHLKTVILDEGVKSIGNYVFYSVHSNPESTEEFEINLPSTLTRIGTSAFYGIQHWKNKKVIIPDSVTTVGEYCFGNTDITEVQISSGVSEIPNYAFTDCSLLASAIIPDSVTTIGTNAFYRTNTIIQADCKAYAISWAKENHRSYKEIHEWDEPEYEWSDDLLSVTASHVCLKDETHVETETVAAQQTTLTEPSCLFTGLANYTSNDFSNSSFTVQIKTNVEISALGHEWKPAEYNWSNGNTSLTATHICKHDVSHKETETVNVIAAITSPMEEAEGNAIYTSEAFKKEGFAIQTKSIVIPALKNMSIMRLPNMIKTIDDEAFSNLACQAIIIPNNCTTIGEKAFAGCTNLLYVKIPASVESYPDNAFEGCNENLVIDWAKE